MSYIRVGTFNGPLEPLVHRALKIEKQASSTGYEATSDQTALLYEAFKDDLSQFPGPWEFSMIVLVNTHGHLPVHADGAMPAGVRRYHLVLQTNPRCWYFHDGEWERLEAGGIYELDPTRDHGAINWGPEPRIHLVIDTRQELCTT